MSLSRFQAGRTGRELQQPYGPPPQKHVITAYQLPADPRRMPNCQVTDRPTHRNCRHTLCTRRCDLFAPGQCWVSCISPERDSTPAT
ncbi:hypothetical protein GCM10017687_53070 [Streptomyces echinatus]